MTLSAELQALRDEAMAMSCEGWAIQKRWPLARGIDRAGPCPNCGGTDRFAIHTRKNTFNCRQCGLSGVGVIDLVMKTENVEFVAACEIVTGRKASDPVDESRMAELRHKAERDARRRDDEARRYRERARRDGHDVWVSSWVPGHGGPVDRYLKIRGIDLDALPPDIRTQVCRVIREYDALPWVEGREGEDRRIVYHTIHSGPAMVAAVQMADDRFGAVHRTWINLDMPKGKMVLPPTDKGKERPSKKVLGIKQGGAIRLYTPPAARRIVMGEGIETTLTPLAHALEEGTAYWAGVDLGNMAGKASRDGDGRLLHDVPDLDNTECFIPPDWCEELVYLGEDDGAEAHALEKAWRGLRRAEALREEARREQPALPPLAVFYVPPPGGGDLNDIVRAKGSEDDDDAT